MLQFLHRHWRVTWQNSWTILCLITLYHAGWEVLCGPLKVVPFYLPRQFTGLLVVAASYVYVRIHCQRQQRAEEARWLWKQVTSTTQQWFAMILQSSSAHALLPVQQRLIHRQLAWVHALCLQLCNQSGAVLQTVTPWLEAQEAARLATLRNPALQLLAGQARHVHEACHVYSAAHQDRLHDTLCMLLSLQGDCEELKERRLVEPPDFPTSMLSAFFLALLPLGLLGEFHWWGHPHAEAALVFSMLISWLWLLLLPVRLSDQDPFADLLGAVPMAAVCRRLADEARRKLNDTSYAAKPNIGPEELR